MQNIPLGTDISGLELPNILTATVRLGVVEENPGQDENTKQAENAEQDMEIPVSDSGQASGDLDPALISNEEDEPEQEDSSEAITMEIPVPVT